MNTAWIGSCQPDDVEVGFEGVDLTTEGVALDDDIEHPELDLSWAGRAGGQEDHPGTGTEHGNASAIRSPERLESARRSASRPMVVDSPPGMTRARCRRVRPGVRTRRLAPSARDHGRRVRESHPEGREPDSQAHVTSLSGRPVDPASAPRSIVSMSMPTIGLSEIARDLGDHRGVLVVGGGFDDRLGPSGRVAALEDSGADEHSVAPELHHEGGIGRRGDATGGEVDDRELAGLGDLFDEVEGGPQVAGRRHQLFGFIVVSRGSRR